MLFCFTKDSFNDFGGQPSDGGGRPLVPLGIYAKYLYLCSLQQRNSYR